MLLKGWREWGQDLPAHLHGMFAFALHDGARTFLVRDRLGVKPLYLAEVDGALRAASTLPALLAGGGVDTRVDPVALHHYLSWHSVVPAPRTILRGVTKVPPATVVAIEPDGRRPPPCTGTRRSSGARTSRTGRKRCATPCSARSGGAWWPTCRSGSS